MKKKFKVIRSHMDGISIGATEDIDETVESIHCSKGWDNLEQLKSAIRRWALQCKPADIFLTQVSAIVCVK